MSKTTFLSPAKLNLFFKVLSKRSDGFHEIASLYSAVSLFDTLSFETSDKDNFSSNLKSMLLIGKNNLVLQARDLFRLTTGCLQPLRIHLEKKIPAQKGLGGGSSNAATTLFAMNSMFHSPLSLFELAHLGAKLGSDVSFFFSTGLAYCTGRGELFSDVEIDAFPKLYIAIPKVHALSTEKVYGVCLKKLKNDISPLNLLNSNIKGEWQFQNDLEGSAFTICPELKGLKRELMKHYAKVSLTGSGSAFFCMGEKVPFNHDDVEIVPVDLCRRSSLWYSH